MNYKASPLMCFQWTMEIDLLSDLKDLFYRILTARGFSDVTKDTSLYQFFNMEKRIITMRPRFVKKAKEFVCPKGYELALNEFEKKIMNGDNLAPFMSEKIKKSAYNDLLLNDWGIQHFHLSRRYRDDGFVQRNEYQIFAYVTETTVYLIQVYPHADSDLYSKKDMLVILQKNWPELLEQFRVPGFVQLNENLTDHEYGEIRKAKAISFVELGEKQVYGMIGGGCASSGLSLDAIRNADFWSDRITELQECLVENAELIGKSIIKIQNDKSASYLCMDIKLLWVDNENQILVVDKKTELIIQLNTMEGFIRICTLDEFFGYEGGYHGLR